MARPANLPDECLSGQISAVPECKVLHSETHVLRCPAHFLYQLLDTEGPTPSCGCPSSDLHVLNASDWGSAGETFEGSTVIVTLPLGCLKRSDIDFKPSLPECKTDAIAKLGYGNLNKVTAHALCNLGYYCCHLLLPLIDSG